MIVAAPAPAAAPPHASQLEFRSSVLGMRLADWRTAPYPGSASAQPVCTGDAGAAALGLAATAAQAGAVVCTYAYPGGPRVAVPLGDGHLARSARYLFRGGRLQSIRYATSPDAFDTLVARIDAQVGPPVRTVRDTVRLTGGETLARVRMSWSSAAGDVVLIDPDAQGQVSVLYSMASPHLVSARR